MEVAAGEIPRYLHLDQIDLGQWENQIMSIPLEKSEVIQLIMSLAEYRLALIEGEDDAAEISIVGSLLTKLFGRELEFTLDGALKKPSDWQAVEKLTGDETYQLISSLETYIEGCAEGPEEIDGVSSRKEIDALDAIICKLS